MTSNLRERRRRQTAREIQQAALRLSLRLGYDAVTADAIAAEAGISPRTFFNYYANKQAAILGVPPCLDPQQSCWFVTSRQPLRDDIVRLLAGLIGQEQMNREWMCLIQRLIDAEPQLLPLFHTALDQVTQTLAELLVQRLGPDAAPQAQLIAALSSSALSLAVRAWAADTRMDQSHIAAMMEQHMKDVCAWLHYPAPTSSDQPSPEDSPRGCAGGCSTT